MHACSPTNSKLITAGIFDEGYQYQPIKIISRHGSRCPPVSINGAKSCKNNVVFPSK